jgi:hypothetical protein
LFISNRKRFPGLERRKFALPQKFVSLQSIDLEAASSFLTISLHVRFESQAAISNFNFGGKQLEALKQGATTFSMMTLSKMTFRITTLSISDTQHNNAVMLNVACLWRYRLSISDVNEQ